MDDHHHRIQQGQSSAAATPSAGFFSSLSPSPSYGLSKAARLATIQQEMESQMEEASVASEIHSDEYEYELSGAGGVDNHIEQEIESEMEDTRSVAWEIHSDACEYDLSGAATEDNHQGGPLQVSTRGRMGIPTYQVVSYNGGGGGCIVLQRQGLVYHGWAPSRNRLPLRVRWEEILSCVQLDDEDGKIMRIRADKMHFLEMASHGDLMSCISKIREQTACSIANVKDAKARKAQGTGPPSLVTGSKSPHHSLASQAGPFSNVTVQVAAAVPEEPRREPPMSLVESLQEEEEQVAFATKQAVDKAKAAHDSLLCLDPSHEYPRATDDDEEALVDVDFASQQTVAEAKVQDDFIYGPDPIQEFRDETPKPADDEKKALVDQRTTYPQNKPLVLFLICIICLLLILCLALGVRAIAPRNPSGMASDVPSTAPSDFLSQVPSTTPSGNPSGLPSKSPIRNPSKTPSHLPSFVPSASPTFPVIRTKTELSNAIYDWISSGGTVTTYGPTINDWDVSRVADFSNLFRWWDTFTDPINNWETSQVTKMSYMFHLASAFNQPLSNWDVSKVTRMSGMFAYSGFNQDISGWNVGAATAMDGMFDATPFNQNLSGWDVSTVRNFECMFCGKVSRFNQDISNWNVGAATTVQNMFHQNKRFNQDLCVWGAHLQSHVVTSEMFLESGCESRISPNLAGAPVSPLCRNCY